MQTPQPSGYFTFTGSKEQSLLLPYIDLGTAGSSYSFATWLRVDAATTPDASQGGCTIMQLISSKGSIETQIKRTDVPRVYKLEVSCGSRSVGKSVALQLGCWHHLAIRHTARRLRSSQLDLWLNSVPLLQDKDLSIPNGTISSAKFGLNLVGALCGVTLYRGLLASEQVAYLYASGPGHSTAWHGAAVPLPMYASPDIRHAAAASASTGVALPTDSASLRASPPPVAALLLPAAGDTQFGGRHCGVWASSGTLAAAAHMSSPAYSASLSASHAGDISRGLSSTFRQAILGQGVQAIVPGKTSALDPMAASPGVLSPGLPLAAASCILGLQKLGGQLADVHAPLAAWVALCNHTCTQLCVSPTFREEFHQMLGPACVAHGVQQAASQASPVAVSSASPVTPPVAAGLLHLFLTCRCSKGLARAGMQHILFNTRVWTSAPCSLQLVWLRVLCTVVAALGDSCLRPSAQASNQRSMDANTILGCMRQSLGSDDAHDAWLEAGQESAAEATALWSWLLCQALLAMLPPSVRSVSLHLQDTFQVNDTKRRVFSGAEGEGTVSGLGVRSTDSGRVGGVAAFMRNIASSVTRQDSSKHAQNAAAFASRRSTGAVGSPLPLLLAQLSSQGAPQVKEHTRLAPKDALATVHAECSALTSESVKGALHSTVRAVSCCLQSLSTAASNMQSEALLRCLLWLLSHPVFHAVFFRTVDAVKGASTALVASMEPCAQSAWPSAVAATAALGEDDPQDEPQEQQRVVLLGLACLSALLGHREATAVGSSVLGQITTNGSVPLNASTEESLAVVSPEMQRSFRAAFPSITAARAYLTLSSALRTVCIMVPLQDAVPNAFASSSRPVTAAAAAGASATPSSTSGFGGASAVGSQGDGRAGRHTGQLSLLRMATHGVQSLGQSSGVGADEDAASLPSPSRLRGSSKSARTPKLSFVPSGRPSAAHTLAGSPRRGRRSSNISFMRSPATDRSRASTIGSKPSPAVAAVDSPLSIRRMGSEASAASGGADDWEVLDGDGASKASVALGSSAPPSVLTGPPEDIDGITLSFAEDGESAIQRSRSGSVLSEFGRASVHLRVGSLGSSSVTIRPKQHAGDGVDVELGAPDAARDSQLRRPRRTHSSTQILAAVLRILVPDAAVGAVNGALSVLGAGSVLDGVDASKIPFPASPHLLCAIQHLLTPSLLKTLSLGRRINESSQSGEEGGAAFDGPPFSPSVGRAGGGARAATVALAAALSEDTLQQLRALDNSDELLLWVALENLAGFMQQADGQGGQSTDSSTGDISHSASMEVLSGLAHAVPAGPLQCAAAINEHVLSLRATQEEQHVSLMVLPSAAVLLMACVRAAAAQVVSAAKHIGTKSTSAKSEERCTRLAGVVDRLVFAPLMWVHSLLKFGDQVSAETARGNARLWLTLRGWQHQLLALVQPRALNSAAPPPPKLPSKVQGALDSASTVALRVYTTLALVALRFEGGSSLWTDTWVQCLALHAHRGAEERQVLATATFAAAAQAVLVAISRDKGALSSHTGTADTLASNVHALLAMFSIPALEAVSSAVASDMLALLPSLHACKLPSSNKVLWRELRFLHAVALKASQSDDVDLVTACVPAVCDSVQNAVHSRLPDLARFSSRGSAGHYTPPKVQYTLPGGNGGVLGVDGEASHVEVLLYLLGCLRPLLSLQASVTKGDSNFDLQELAGSMVMAVFNSCRFGPLEVQVSPWRDESLGAGASPEAMLPKHRPAVRANPTSGPNAKHATKAARALDALSCIETALSAVVERANSSSLQSTSSASGDAAPTAAAAASAAGAASTLAAQDEDFLQLPDARQSLNPLIIESAAWDVHARSLSMTPLAALQEEAASPPPTAPDGGALPAHVWGMYRLGLGISLAASAAGPEEVQQARFRAIAAFIGGMRKAAGRLVAPLQRELRAPEATLGGLAVTDVPLDGGDSQVQLVDASAALQSLQAAPTAGWKLDSHDSTSALIMPFGGWGVRTRLVQAADTALTAQSYKDYSIASNSSARPETAEAAAADTMEKQGAALAAQLAAAGAVTDIAAEQQAASAVAEEGDSSSEAGSTARDRGASAGTTSSLTAADDAAADEAEAQAETEEAEEAAMDAALEVSQVAHLFSSAQLVVRARLLNAKGPTRGTLFLLNGRYVWRPEASSPDAGAEWVDVPSIVREEGDDSDDDVQPSTQLAMQRSGWSPKRTRQLAWNAKDVCGVWMRTYCLQSTALELEVARYAGPRRRRYFFTFVRRDVRDKVANRLIETLGGQPRAAPRHSLAHRVPFSPPHAKAGEVLLASGLPAAWSSGELSNMEYLLALNSMAGRSMHDTNQYPVFPWVLADYNSEELDLAHPASFRDLRRPMGALTRARLLEFRSRFESLGGGEVTDANDAPAGILPFMYGSHYSTSVGTVMHYLLRLFPFTAGHALTQEGHFDVADRLFASVPEAWRLATQSLTEVKELTPEWYSTPAFLLNLSKYNFGETQDGDPVGDVRLPKWVDTYTYPYVSLVPKAARGQVKLPPQAQPSGRSPMARARAFIAAQREALESPFVTARLHNWIDLVFGQKQRGPAAVEADNVFYYCTYEGAVNVEAVKDSTIRKALKLQILHYGQTPTQLLSTPHPNHSTKAASASRPHSIADDLRAARSVVDFAACTPALGASETPPATPSAADGSGLSMIVTFHHAAIHRSAKGGYSLWRPVFAPGQSAGDMADAGSKVAFSLGDAISLGGVPPPATLMLSAPTDTVADLVLAASEDGTTPDAVGAGKGADAPPPLAYPLRYNLQLQLASDSENNVCIWSAVPPAGYVALGCIASLVATPQEGGGAASFEGAAAQATPPVDSGTNADDRMVSPTPKTGSGASAQLQQPGAASAGGRVPPPLDAMVCVHASLVLDAKLSQRVHVPLSSIEVSVDVPADEVEEEEILRIDSRMPPPSEAAPAKGGGSGDWEAEAPSPPAQAYRRIKQHHVNAIWAVHSPANAFVVPDLASLLQGRADRSAKAQGGAADGSLQWHGEQLNEVADDREWQSYLAADAMAFTLNPARLSSDSSMSRRLPGWDTGMAGPWGYASWAIDTEDDIVALCALDEANGRILAVSSSGSLHMLRVAAQRLELPQPPAPVASADASDPGVTAIVAERIASARTQVAGVVSAVGQAVSYALGEPGADGGTFTGWLVRDETGQARSLYSMVRHVGLVLRPETRTMELLQDMTGIDLGAAPPPVTMHVPVVAQTAAQRRCLAALKPVASMSPSEAEDAGAAVFGIGEHLQLCPVALTPSGRVAVVGAGPGAGAHLTAMRADRVSGIVLDASLTLPPTSSTASITAVAVAPDGDWVALGHDDGSTQLWPVAHLHAGWGRLIGTSARAPLSQPMAAKRPLHVLKGGQFAAAGDATLEHDEKAWAARVHSGAQTSAAAPQAQVPLELPTVTCISVSASEDTVLVGHVGEAWLYELARGRPLRRFTWAAKDTACFTQCTVACIGAHFVAGGGVLLAWSGHVTGPSGRQTVSCVMRHEVGAFAEAPTATWSSPCAGDSGDTPLITASAPLDARAPQGGYSGHTPFGGVWGPKQAAAFDAAVKSGNTKRAFGHRGPREVVAIGDTAGRVTLLDALDCAPLVHFQSQAQPVRSIVASPCGGYIVSAGGSGAVRAHALPALSCVAGTTGTAFVDSLGEHLYTGADRVKTAAMSGVSSAQDALHSGKGLAEEVGSLVKGVWGNWFGGKKK